MSRVDLHTHSFHSDGSVSPSEVVRRAREAGLAMLALTDHDNAGGLDEAEREARAAGLVFARGIEINTREGELHVLGYGIGRGRAPLDAWVKELGARRVRRVALILEKLVDLGMAVSMEDVLACRRGVVGRPHVADALCRKGIAANRGEAFGRWLASGRPAYVPSLGPSPEEAIDAIREAGGFAVLAHPDTVEDLAALDGLVKRGLEGIEARYTAYAPGLAARFAGLAGERGLLVTGGSDFHGPGTSRDHPLGVDLPDREFHRFAERLARCS